MISQHIRNRWSLPKIVHTSSGIDRYVLFQTPWLSVEFHKINEPDEGFLVHQHPWTFFSFRVRGGYTEELYINASDTTSYEVKRGWLRAHTMWWTSAHRIKELHGTPITLFITGPPHLRGIRFWTKGKPFDISKYLPEDAQEMLNIYPDLPA